jgi:catechol 2,3-dioxygenase-like lactoylglutathione lyase family enzyme
MKTLKNIDVLFVAGFGPIVRDPAASRKFYSEALGLTFKEDTDGYLHKRLSPALARINGLSIFPCHKGGSNLT